MRVVAIVIAVGWVVFWLYWVASAFGVKAGRTRWRHGAALRVAIVLVVLVLVRLHAVRTALAPIRDPALQGIGLALFALGLALAVWARVHIGRNWGTPMSQKADPELVTTGPYSSVRHPIYSGILLAMIGSALAVSLYWLVALALVGPYFLYSAVVEERYMTRLFPEQYPAYQRSTKMLIPFVL
ncbi:protein-S-isoprenylcysteine O-methyltransferase Ste14 [Kitasatospora sp. MAP12-15]|uniref:methyltransferase family protein n=1 Tax=unclassified Kitasatospora TaxID=2633591 RepID=UPI002474520F|nr:isoprenylcysteine carboxylmethyltransferase family protein [Kitasatospora sp. MAP12-44]MDH6108557.1 protein-S-isoprenylcysteine O-methyltransferase Ste14 [Kitasatospora sp. MAP12-44]